MVIQIGRLETPVSFPKNDDEWHSFLKGNVEEALTVREFVDNLPTTAATFELKDIDGFNEKRLNPDALDSVLKLAGSWRVPDLFASNRPQKWVNPNYNHAQHYSDVATECGCGIPVLRMTFGEDEKQPAHHQDHAEDCTKINRLEARAQLLKNRRDIIRDAYNHAHAASAIQKRLGYAEDKYMGGYEIQQLGINGEELAKESRRKMARTAMVLCREYSPKDVATLFGVHRRSISQLITQETVTDSKTLYGIRRAV